MVALHHGEAPVPGLIHDRGVVGTVLLGFGHEASAQRVPAEVVGGETGGGGRALEHEGHRLRAQSLGAHVAVPVLISLRYLVEIIRHRSLSRAAISLGIVQPALTRRIKLLEEQLGVELLTRHRRGVEPTEAGLLVLERAELILRMAQQLETEVRSQGAEPAGQVGFAFPPSVGILFVGKILSECATRYPRIKLYLHEDFSPAVRDGLLSGRIDIGIMTSELGHPDLIGKPLFKEAMWLIARPQDWTFKSRRLKLGHLNDIPLVLGSFTREMLERVQPRSPFRLRIGAEVDSYTLVIESIRAGAGFAVVPSSAVDRQLREKEFVGAPIEGFDVTRTLFRHRDRPPTRASLVLMDLIDFGATYQNLYVENIN